MRTALDDALDDVVGPTPPPAPKPGPAPGTSTVPPAATVTGHLEVPVGDLRASENNPRERMTGIEDLATSIREQGLIQPIIARRTDDGSLVVVAGHRRLEAVKRLGWMRVEVIVRRDMRPDAELAAMLVENGQRAGLDPIEEARALARLKALSACTDGDLARKVGRSQQTVSARLALLSLPIEEQEAVRAGQTSLQEATYRGREASGRIRVGAKGKKGPAHLATHHPLARLAKARCLRLKHSRGPGSGVGGIACGECWESVIRADERQHLHSHSARTGECATCGGSYSDGADT